MFKTANPAYVAYKIDEAEEGKVEDKQTSLANKIRSYLIVTRLDDKQELVNAILSLVFSLIFAIETYFPKGEPVPGLVYVFLPILSWLTLDWLLNLYISRNRLQYIFGFESFITYITLIPQTLITLEFVTDPDTIGWLELNFWKVFRIFSCQRMNKIFERQNKILEHA